MNISNFFVLIVALSTLSPYTLTSEDPNFKRQFVALQLTDSSIIVLTKQEYKENCRNLFLTGETCSPPFSSKFYCIPLKNLPSLTTEALSLLKEQDSRLLTRAEKQALQTKQQELYMRTMQELEIELTQGFSSLNNPFNTENK